jgi:hypothetical protein
VAEKRQFMALVEPDTLCRADALRIVKGRSRARVTEDLIRAQLPKEERKEMERLERLKALAGRLGVTLEELTTQYAMLYARKTYGPTLEELEADPDLLKVPVLDPSIFQA